MTAWCHKSVKQRSVRERVKFNDLILTSLETRSVQSVSVVDTLYLMILLCVSKGSAARFFADFACRCIYWTALSLYPLFCWVRNLLILPLKTVCLRSLRLVMSASVSQWKTLSIYDQLEHIDSVKVKKLKLAAAAKKYGIGYSTAAKILKKEDDLRSGMQMNRNTNRKRKCQSMH